MNAPYRRFALLVGQAGEELLQRHERQVARGGSRRGQDVVLQRRELGYARHVSPPIEPRRV
jgi:hypothetical protein